MDTRSAEIIDRCFYEYTHDEIINCGLIKPFNPIPKEVTNITGITNKDVAGKDDITQFLLAMTEIVDRCKSVIFIAHNGYAFDHLILKRLKVLKSNCKLLDSRSIITHYTQENTGHMSLSNIYELVLGHPYNGTPHRAIADVKMMVHIFKKFGITASTLQCLPN